MNRLRKGGAQRVLPQFVKQHLLINLLDHLSRALAGSQALGLGCRCPRLVRYGNIRIRGSHLLAHRRVVEVTKRTTQTLEAFRLQEKDARAAFAFAVLHRTDGEWSS